MLCPFTSFSGFWFYFINRTILAFAFYHYIDIAYSQNDLSFPGPPRSFKFFTSKVVRRNSVPNVRSVAWLCNHVAGISQTPIGMLIASHLAIVQRTVGNSCWILIGYYRRSSRLGVVGFVQKVGKTASSPWNRYVYNYKRVRLC